MTKLTPLPFKELSAIKLS